ncbi:MAG: type I glyceraldehyde-3-phosphate dehydrogenase, partial [Bacteroidia bacterium]|nr:type I glyceraldehyde-3-phosphate dehydrogenase [Bacteroidia bacterium]
MEKIRIAINGFGRIGRMTARAMLRKNNFEIVAINDLTDTTTLAHLFKYDSIHGRYSGTVSHKDKEIIIDGKSIKVFSEKDPSALPWSSLKIDVVLESTGRFTDSAKAGAHIKAGAKKVIITAPMKSSGSEESKTIVLGVNDDIISGDETIVSNASCTTNNAAPMIKILDEVFGIESAFVTTIHAYTGDQNIHDAPHKDLRRARAAAMSIIPTTTGAAKALTDVFPHLDGKIGGAGIRVPVACGSMTDITCVLKRNADVKEINDAFRKESQSAMKNILEYTEDPIVSADIVGSPYSCIFDAQLTSSLGKVVKVVGWYDNETGYS